MVGKMMSFLTTFMEDLCPNSFRIKSYGLWSWVPSLPKMHIVGSYLNGNKHGFLLIVQKSKLGTKLVSISVHTLCKIGQKFERVIVCPLLL